VEAACPARRPEGQVGEGQRGTLAIEELTGPLAFDAIAKAGPGGMYLASSHTLDNFRSALYRSELASLEDVNLWTEQGSKDTLVRANERYKGILEAYEDPGLDDAIDAELQEFMAKRKSEIETSTGGD